jgi:hypothetical protein
MALVVLALARSDLTGAAVADLRARARPEGLVLALVLMCGGMVFLALRWRALMPDRRGVRVVPLAGLLVVGTLLNYALPGPVGEFAAAAIAGRRFGMPAEVAFAAGTSARFVGLAMAGLVAALLFVVSDLPVPEGTAGWIGAATAAVTSVAVGLAALAAWPDALRRVADLTLGRVGFLRGLHASVVRFVEALRAVGRLPPLRWAEAAAWALCGHALVVGGIFVALRSLGSAPDVAGLAFTYTMSTAGSIVLFAFPGSQVGWDAMFASLLVTTAAVPAPDAVAVAIVVRVQQLVLVALGAMSLLRARMD